MASQVVQISTNKHKLKKKNLTMNFRLSIQKVLATSLLKSQITAKQVALMISLKIWATKKKLIYLCSLVLYLEIELLKIVKEYALLGLNKIATSSFCNKKIGCKLKRNSKNEFRIPK